MTKELIERIRVQMKKHPNSSLWNKDRNKWTKDDDKEFERLESGKSLKPSGKSRIYGGSPVKVIRISDGYIYKSVRECMNQNGYHTKGIQQMLNTETKYKRCEN